MAKRSRPASTRTSWIPPAFAGVVFIAGGVWMAQAVSAASNIIVLTILGVVVLVGAGLLMISLSGLLSLYRASRAATSIRATVLEIRRDVVDGRNQQFRSWKVIARGAWPDGRTEEFESAPLKQNPSDRIFPGQAVIVRGDIGSGVYAMDLSTVSGTARAAAEMRPKDPIAPTTQSTAQPGKGLAIGAAMIAVGVLIGIVGHGHGDIPVMGAMVAAFGAGICLIVYLSWRFKRRLEVDGATFPVRISRIGHERHHAGSQDYDQWTIEAKGIWPDGVEQTFYGEPLTSLGQLKEGDMAWVRGDPKTRIYALRLTQS